LTISDWSEFVLMLDTSSRVIQFPVEPGSIAASASGSPSLSCGDLGLVLRAAAPISVLVAVVIKFATRAGLYAELG
jgi:hypothetical protein